MQYTPENDLDTHAGLMKYIASNSLHSEIDLAKTGTIMTSPIAGETGVAITGPLEWNQYRNFTRYRVVVTRVSDSVVVIDQQVEATTYDTNLDATTEYSWKVFALVKKEQTAPTPDPNVTGVTILPSSPTLGVDDTVQLSADVEGTNLTDTSVTWSKQSGDTDITINSSGLVTSSATASDTDSAVFRATADQDGTTFDEVTVTVAVVSTLDSRTGDEAFITDLANDTDVATKVDSSWNTADLSSPPTGVTVDTIGGELRITRIELFGNDIAGTLPSSVGNLKKCNFFNIKHNKFTGQIPNTILRMESVVHLLLAGAAHSDPTGVPNENTDHYPSKVDWDGNTFEGNFPNPSDGDLPNIEFLDCSRNNFNDENLPEGIGYLTTLKGLYLNNNGYVGTIPALWNNLVNITYLQIIGGTRDFSYNWVSGIQPKSLSGTLDNLSNLLSLKSIRVQYNNLTGELPDNWKNNPNWKDVKGTATDLGGNGQIPTIFSEGVAKPNLTGLQFRGTTKFTGPIPDDYSNLNLGTFYFTGNDFDGYELKQLVWDWTRLIIIDVTDCNFSGTIPDDLSHISNLRNIYVAGNKLTGTLPSIFTSANYVNFTFGNNLFTGSIPASHGSLDSALGVLGLFYNNNFLEGTVPDFSGYLSGNQGRNPIINVENNKFVFADLAPNLTANNQLDNFSYQTQKRFGDGGDVSQAAGTTFEIDYSAKAHVDDSYQWYKDGVALTDGGDVSGATTHTLTITNISSPDQGSYELRMTNSTITDVQTDGAASGTLLSELTELTVT